MGAICLIGFLLRLAVFNQSGYGDEMSTLWIVKGNDLAGIIPAVNSDAEISPPFFFLLAKLATVFGQSVAAIRLPSLIAGMVSLPVIYLLALKTLGRRAAFYALAVASISPFLVSYSGNARGYALMILMVLLSALALVAATSENGRWWHWCGYSVAAALTVYSHYVGALAIAGQVLWVLVCFPSSRLKVIGWSLVAALLFAPWLGGFRADLDSPTTEILQFLQGTGFRVKVEGVSQMLFTHLSQEPAPVFWDRPDILLGCVALLFACVGVFSQLGRGALQGPWSRRSSGVLLAVFMVFTPIVGELVLLAFGTDIFGTRNLAPVWAGLPLLYAAVCVAAGRRWGLVAMTFLLAALLYGSVRIADPEKSTIDYRSAAEQIEKHETPGGAVLDASIISPAPQTPLDAYLDTEMTVVRPRAYKDEPDFIHDIFRNFNPQRFVNSAFSNPGPVNVVTVKHSQEPHLTEGPGGRRYRFQLATPYNVNATVTIPRGWVEIERTSFPGLLPITVTRFKRTDRNPAASRSTNGKPAEQEASKGSGNGN